MTKTMIRKPARPLSAQRPARRKKLATLPTPRQRLLQSATQLFCRNGINATGVDAIIAGAGTAKTTLYKEFGSKEKLVHIVLETEGKLWRDWFFAAADKGGGDARTRLLRVFVVLKQWFASESFFGCPFINAIGEHDKKDKSLRALTLKHKRVVLGYLEALARELGVASPGEFSHQIALLMDGAIVAAMVTGNPRVADTAGFAAEMLIETMRAPSRAARRSQTGKRLELA